jgi:hypothetical protein
MRVTRNSALILAVVTAAIAFLSVPSVAHAQSTAIKISVPFEFHVGNLTLPPGSYVVKRIGEGIQVSDRRGHAATVITNQVSNRSTVAHNQVVFTQYGRQFFLSEARWQGFSSARRLPQSKAEIELARTQIAERVDLAASAR